MDASLYANAAIPEPFTVLGLRLRPLSIGHLILLHRLGSPFVTEGVETLSVGDLAVACLVCSGTFADGIALLESATLANDIYYWGLRSTNQHGWRKFTPWLYRPIDLKSKVELFSDYLKYHLECPTYSVEDGKGKAINAPAWQVVRVVLLSKTNLTDQEIMDRPYRLCMADFITLRAIEGQVEIYDGAELEEAQRMANEFAAQMAAKRGGGNGST